MRGLHYDDGLHSIEQMMSNNLRTVLLLGIAVAAFAVYARTLQFHFVYDDTVQIVLNQRIRSWSNVPAYFQTNVWNEENNGYYRPIFLIWLLLNHTLFGYREWGWHLLNILLHVGATLLVFALARRFLPSEWAAVAAALLFAVLPAHVESITWVSGSTDPLLTIFFVGSYLAFLRAYEAPAGQGKWISLSLALSILALLSKEPGVMLVPLLAAHIWLFRKNNGVERGPTGRWPTLLKMKIVLPYGAAVAVYLAVRSAVLHRTIGVVETPLSWTSMLLTWPWLLWFYAKKLIWPPPMSAFYDAPYLSSASFAEFWAPLLLLLAVAALLLWWYRRTRDQVVPWACLWILLTLAPTMNLRLFMPHDYAHDRYLYLPSVAFCILLASLLWQIPWRKIAGEARAQTLRWGTVGIIVVAFAGVTVLESAYWANNLVLYARGIQTAPKYGTTALSNIIPELMSAGRTSEAAANVREVARRKPQDIDSQFNAGSILLKLGKYAEAEGYFKKAAQLSVPNNALSLLHIGLTRMMMGKPAEAEAPLREAAAKSGQNPEFRYALALDLKQQGRLAEARDILQALVASAPDRNNYRIQLEQVQAALAEKNSHAR